MGALLNSHQAKRKSSREAVDSSDDAKNTQINKTFTSPVFSHDFTETDVKVKIGSKLYLHCPADGYPEPKIVWHKDGSPVFEIKDTYFQDWSLTKENIAESDEGLYTCIISNIEGSISYNFTVEVVKDIPRPPVFTKPGRMLPLIAKPAGSSAVLKCPASGYPIPEITWYKDQKPLEKDSHRVKFEQISVFERGRIVGLREAGLSYRAVATSVQRNSRTIMHVSKQWTDEGRTARKSVSGPRNVTSAREDRRLVRMAQTDRTAFSRQLAAQWSTATRVSLCASSIRRCLLQRGLRARIPLYRIPLTQNHRRLRLHWANVHRSWRADWQQVVFSDKSRFNLWHHDGRIESGSMPVNGAFWSALSNATVDEHPELWSGVP
ncbi:hemicentin-2 [Trichonephila clavipes]|nr:hemicentin-2 [Trichonephila clavipes]